VEPLLARRTPCLIGHRLSRVRRAGLVLLMAVGRVIERGSHDDLMAARGVYYRMVMRQMESNVQNIEEALGEPAGDEVTPPQSAVFERG